MLSLFQGCLGLSFKNWTGLSCGLTMDRIAGLQDLQDRLFWLSWGLKMDRIAILQDCRIACFGLAVG
jgi:hypothetical protein